VQVTTAGRTDAAIARDLLREAGIGDAAIDAQAGRVVAASSAAFADLCPDDLSATLAPGAVAVLDALGGQPGAYRPSLLTGNFEPIARLKLERAGIGGYFPVGQGAFGNDAEARAELPPIARRRAGGWPAERTVIIGDTPEDIACARADGAFVIAVATGPFEAPDLAAADAVVDGLPAALPVLAELAGRG
jgi:phosphoglycolate phosphatase-like HAD superfamily hydrolase